MDLKGILMTGLILFLIFLVSGCSSNTSDITGEAIGVNIQKIKIGALLPLTGDKSVYGENVKRGIELAQKEISFDVLYEDSKCNYQEAILAIQKLIENNVDVIIGELCSSATLAVSQIAKEAGITLISPASTSSDLTDEGDHFFRTVPSDTIQGKKAAELIQERGYKNLAVLYINDDYGIGLEKILRENFPNIVASESFSRDSDVTAQLTSIKKSNPDAIYIISNSPISAGRAIKQIKELGITAQIFGSDGLKDNSVLTAAEGAAEGIFLTSLANSNTLIGKQFVNKYKKNYGSDPGVFAAEAYDAMVAIEEAAKNSDRSHQGIMHAMNEVKFEGASGLIAFDHNGDVLKSFTTVKVINGQFVEL